MLKSNYCCYPWIHVLFYKQRAEKNVKIIIIVILG